MAPLFVDGEGLPRPEVKAVRIGIAIMALLAVAAASFGSGGYFIKKQILAKLHKHQVELTGRAQAMQGQRPEIADVLAQESRAYANLILSIQEGGSCDDGDPRCRK